MKRTVQFNFFVFLVILITSASGLSATGVEDASDDGILEVYCYDSFASEWGPGPLIVAAFEEQTGIQVNLHAPGDAVTVLNQLIIEKDSPRADVVVGLDNSLLPRVLEAGILESYDSPALSTVPESLIFDNNKFLLPFDYGHFAICYDSEILSEVPSSLEDLTAEQYTDSLVLTDPRTSTPGLGFLLWTVSVYGDEWISYWERLRPSILTISDSWSQAYALFTAGEAPLVLSYGTSPVYHVEYEGSERYRAAEFTDGHITQIEGMGIVSGTADREAAETFIDFILGAESQNYLAMSNIMLPVNSEVELAGSFDFAMKPAETIDSALLSTDSGDIEAIIEQWTGVFTR